MKRNLLHSSEFTLTLGGAAASAQTLLAAEPPYVLALQGAHNVRDLGGYQTTDGRQVRLGMLYRGSELSRLSDADQQLFLQLHIREVVDMRSDVERQQAPDQLPVGIRYVPLPINVEAAAVGDIQRHIFAADNTPAAMRDFLQSAYRDFILHHTPQFRQFLQGLLVEGNLPQVFHCTAGKDRTGIASALVLSALGVPWQRIMEDYLASNALSTEAVEARVAQLLKYSHGVANPAALCTLLQVQPLYLETAFSTIDEQYGSVDSYLSEALGMGPTQRQKLRETLLEP